MYSIVADVERYPQFLPWCAGLRVLSRAKEGDNDIVVAEMLVGFKALRERYTSRVVLDSRARSIDVTQTEGVFKRLDTRWRFAPEGEKCRLEFYIAYEFKSRLLNAAAGAAFNQVAKRMVLAYEARAKKLSSSLSPSGGEG